MTMKIVELHPDNPQPRLVRQIVAVLNDGGTIALPTDSGYAVACMLGNKDGMDVIRRIRTIFLCCASHSDSWANW